MRGIFTAASQHTTASQRTAAPAIRGSEGTGNQRFSMHSLGSMSPHDHKVWSKCGFLAGQSTEQHVPPQLQVLSRPGL